MSAALSHAVRHSVQQIAPLDDPRWPEFLAHSANSTVFHTRAWLEALRQTYDYEPVVLTTTPSGRALENGILFSRVQSWLTGDRLVSLPFSDHCIPLVEDLGDIQRIFSAAEDTILREKMNYLELRVPSALEIDTSLSRSECSYFFHRLDLSPDLDSLFHRFHKSSTQRKIRRAEREGLTYEEGNSDVLVDMFYRLMVMTRRRLLIPPQPKQWFRNLAHCFGDRLKIRVAWSKGQPAAAILTLRHKDTLVYKNGASDARFHKLGPMHLLFWNCIQEAKREGMRVLDLGRSSVSDEGLITFKDRWGAERSALSYTRYGVKGRMEYRPDGTRQERIARSVVSRLPDRLFIGVGQALYRHVG